MTMSATNNPVEIRPVPEVSALALTFWDRLMGRRLSLPLPRAPQEPAEGDLAGDLFWALYRDMPPRDPPPAERAVNAALLGRLRAQPEWGRLLEACKGDIPVSLLTAGPIWASLLEEEAIREALEAQAAAERDRAEAQRREAQAELAEARGQEQEAEALRAEAEALRRQAAEKAAAGVRVLEIWEGQDPERAGLAYGAALARGAEAAREALEAARGWGFERGQLRQLPPEQALALLRRMRQPRLMEIARLAGRLRGIARRARRQRVPAGLVPVGLGRTRDFPDILPEELAMISREAPAALRARKAAEWAADGLLGLRRAQDRQQKGPFFAAVDVSGSMRGLRETVAKALALGLAMLAREEGRDFRLAAFSSAGDPLITVDAEEARRDPEALLRWASASYGGGTDFDRPLRAGMEWIRGRPMADLLFISDGEARPSERAASEWRRFREATGARLLYVPVARGYGAMEALADRVFPVSELLPEDGEELARRLGLAWR
jgi:uncharacterized protein with von Willebrand factor type A (vWA) domain